MYIHIIFNECYAKYSTDSIQLLQKLLKFSPFKFQRFKLRANKISNLIKFALLQCAAALFMVYFKPKQAIIISKEKQYKV